MSITDQENQATIEHLKEGNADPTQDAISETNQALSGYFFPSLFTRIQAVTIDGLIMLAVFVLTSYLIDLAGGAPNWLRASILITMVYLYEPLLISTIGGTLGHLIMKIGVRRYHKPQRKVNIFAALVRLLLKVSLGWLSFVTVTSSNKKRAIHDMGSGSIVLDFSNK